MESIKKIPAPKSKSGKSSMIGVPGGRKLLKYCDNPITGYLYDKTDESRLWRRCIIQAIRDAAKGNSRQKLEIVKWIEGPDFDSVCHYAAIDADFLQTQLTDILAMPPIPARLRYNELKLAIL